MGLGGAPRGTAFFGNWDTPHKAMAYRTKADAPLGNTDVYGFNASSPGFNCRAAAGRRLPTPSSKGFDVRANHAVAYFSPRLGGRELQGHVHG